MRITLVGGPHDGVEYEIPDELVEMWVQRDDIPGELSHYELRDGVWVYDAAS